MRIRDPVAAHKATSGLVVFSTLAVLAVTGTALWGCSLGPIEPVEVPQVQLPALVTAPSIHGAVCIDTSGSMPSQTVREAVATIVELVEDWVEANDTMEGSIEPIPALQLDVRRLLPCSSFAETGQSAFVDIPGVPGLPPQPQLGEEEYARRIGHWRRLATQREVAAKKARERAAAGAAAIRNADWSDPGESEIYGCITAALLTTAGRGPRRLVLISDLESNVTPQTHLADWSEAKLLVVHSCRDSAACSARRQEWADWVTGAGGELFVTRPENMRRDVQQFLRTGDLR